MPVGIGMTFTVTVAQNGITFPCEPREFVLDAAERAGYTIAVFLPEGRLQHLRGWPSRRRGRPARPRAPDRRGPRRADVPFPSTAPI